MKQQNPIATEERCSQEEATVERLIKPAILKLVAESDGGYRCERDLHLHFTLCLDKVMDLGLGTTRRLLHAEHPTFACYGSGRKGNLDFFVRFQGFHLVNQQQASDGVPIELNYDYRDGHIKIVRDIQKLIDPASAYRGSVYFAYGTKRAFFEEVRAGIVRAFEYFAQERTDFRLPAGLHVFVVERIRAQNGHTMRETWVREACTPDELRWTQTSIPGASFP